MTPTPRSQNGWPVLQPASPTLHTWAFPPRVERHLRLRGGSAGFLLVLFAELWHDKVEPIDDGPMDDWGHNVRKIGGTSTYSNHASGTALDINATQHPQHAGVARTFTTHQVDVIHQLLIGRLRSTLRWGGDWSTRNVDGMHVELAVSLGRAEDVARKLIETRRGRRLVNLNPGQRQVILS